MFDAEFQADCLMGVWIISDTHWGHDNIVKYCKRPEGHDQIMINNWKMFIRPQDVVLHLGDIGLRGPKGEKLQPRVKVLPGKKYFIRGNHDTRSTAEYAEMGWHEIKPFSFVWQDKLVFLTHAPMPPEEMLDFYINIHGHIHNNGYDPNFKEGPDWRNVSVEVMSYFPYRLRSILGADGFEGVYQSRKDAGVNQYVAR